MTNKINRPEDYKYIYWWHRLTGSMDYYIEQLQRRAASEQAPLNACYRSYAGWITADEVQNKSFIRNIEAKIKENSNES